MDGGDVDGADEGRPADDGQRADDERWPAQWLRGVLSVCVLAVVAEGETYGYAVARRLEEAGLGTIKGGTLYPVLTRLEQDGRLVSSWRDGDAGPGRKYFHVTAAGRALLAEQTRAWSVFTRRTTALMPTAAPRASEEPR